MILKKGNDGANFVPHPETEVPVFAVIVDITPPKERTKTWEGKTQMVQEIKIVYETEVEDDEGKRFCLWSRGYRIDGKDPLHEKSALRGDLKKILGRDLTATELEGFEVESLLGRVVKVIVEHEQTERGLFARIVLLKAAKEGETFKSSGTYIRVKDRPERDAGYKRADSAAGEKAPRDEKEGSGGGDSAASAGWESTKIHLEGYNGLPLCDMDLETIEKLVKEELPKLEGKEKKSIADKRLIVALTEAKKEIS